MHQDINWFLKASLFVCFMVDQLFSVLCHIDRRILLQASLYSSVLYFGQNHLGSPAAACVWFCLA